MNHNLIMNSVPIDCLQVVNYVCSNARTLCTKLNESSIMVSLLFDKRSTEWENIRKKATPISSCF